MAGDGGLPGGREGGRKEGGRETNSQKLHMQMIST